MNHQGSGDLVNSYLAEDANVSSLAVLDLSAT